MNRNTWQIRILQLENVMKPGSLPGKQSNQYHTINSIPNRPVHAEILTTRSMIYAPFIQFL